MPRWLRIVLTAWSFLLFFGGSPLIGIFVLPVMRLVARDREDHRRRCTLWIGRMFRFFTRWCTFARHFEIASEPVPPLPELVPGEPYVLVSNHPSLIDLFFHLGFFEGMTCVAKGSWYRGWVLGPLLRQTCYLPGPGAGEDENEDMLGAMVAHLRAGHPLLVYPEGSRSLPDRLRRFRRGAVEAAVRAQVPIVATFIAIDRPYLEKGVPWWKVPRGTPRYTIERIAVIDTEGLGPEDSKRIHADLQQRYQSRFARMLADRADRGQDPGSQPREITKGPTTTARSVTEGARRSAP